VNTTLASSLLLSNLIDGTAYEVQVATVCGGVTGAYSASVNFTTPTLSYCTSSPTGNTSTSGYISNVTVTPTNAPIMVSNSGSDGYKDYSTDATRLVILEEVHLIPIKFRLPNTGQVLLLLMGLLHGLISTETEFLK
jgi:hypothetical protein